MNDLTENTACLACGSSNLVSALNLGEQPLANSFKKKPKDEEKKYPLGVNLCRDCYHLQLTYTVDPKIIYSNYLYVSGTSSTLKDYSDWFASYVDQQIEIKSNAVLDIGCNDGTQLDSFKLRSYKTYGVDPAKNIYPISSAKHKVICDYFGPGIENKLNVKFDAIVAQNVAAHNPNPYDFLSTCANMMSDHTLLFIQTSQADMVMNNEFDTIYHEHINFFNVNSMNALAKRVGINLIDAFKTPIHGNSYVFVFSLLKTNPYTVQNKILMENKLLQVETYQNWAKTVRNNVTDLITTINQYRNDGYKIIGYGAAAKGNTLLNYANLTLDLIVDDSPLKQGLFTPGTNVEIKAPDTISKFAPDDKILYVPLAWNFFKEISEKIKFIRKNDNDKFLKYFPKVEVHV